MSEFNGRAFLRERRPGILQVIAPLFHEDGDMVDIFIDLPSSGNGNFMRVSDHGMTLMRLSYSYEIDTPTKQRVLDRILLENGVSEDRGRFFIETTPEHFFPALLQFAQTVAKVSNMHYFKREVVQSLFYETLDDFVVSSFSRYRPTPNYLPIAGRDELEVDWGFSILNRHIYLYGVKDGPKARLAALACREFQIARLPFRSVIVHEDFENSLTKKDKARITSAADKQFTSLSDFQSNGEEYFARELVSSPNVN